MQNYDPNIDYHSYANTQEVITHHINLTLAIDFDLKILSGTASLHLKHITPSSSTKKLVLDCRDLLIKAITDDMGTALPFCLLEGSNILGQPLQIALKAETDVVIIEYETIPDAQGLQWLSPEQTAGKIHPYLFSQSQPINARSWIPLQDSPKARITFNATIKAPKGLRVVMSADNNSRQKLNGEFTFSMPQPIPTHLLAIACGELAFQSLGPRAGVYTEPCMLNACATEFEDTEKMIDAAESILGDYRWERYDMIVLPSSFPFGGMENPRLAFMTPTLIAGDKSLVSTVAHELAHSWTGNLVSNATWRDLWLNEGFTTYFTNRIIEKIYGKEWAELEVVLEFERLKLAMQSTPLSSQTVTFNNQLGDPNDAFNRFTYDKASMFVHELERRLGRNDFDVFLRKYVKRYEFHAITTEDFIAYCKCTLLQEHSDKISEKELLTWVYGEGLPEWFKQPKSDSLEKVKFALNQFFNDTPALKLDVTNWTTHHWQYFITQLPPSIQVNQLTDLDQAFKLTLSQNAEIAFAWFLVAIENNYAPALSAIEEFLIRVGRAKFVKPLYQALIKHDLTDLAQSIYSRARLGYHPSIVSALDAIVYR